MADKEVEEIIKKFSGKLKREIAAPLPYSSEYLQFKEEIFPSLTRFERVCKNCSRILRTRASKKDEARIQEALDTAHLDISASDVTSFAVFILLATFVLAIVFSFSMFLIKGATLEEFPFILLFLLLFFGLFLFFYIINAPIRIAQSWRLKASSQMVPCVLYVVIYMRHTSNLERAIKFASEHLQAPLALDLKKVFWDVEVGKYSTVKESLDAYLERWRNYSVEFIEAFHLIESSLYEPSESRRIMILEKSLEVILDGVYEKMLHYTHDVKAPLTNLYMLGVILPTLGLALLPLASTLLGGMIKWYHVVVLFDMIIPFGVFYLTFQVLSKRPGGYGETELLEQSPGYVQYASTKPYWIAAFAVAPLFLLGIAPLLFATKLPQILGLQNDIKINIFGGLNFFDFKTVAGTKVGPFGIGALMLSFFVPLSIALFFSISYKIKTKELLKARQASKLLEEEFASSLFQLGSRLGDGVPAEIAFGRVAQSTAGTTTAGFFKIVNTNIQQLGMSVESAIFDQKRGAINEYPSPLIKTSMHILVEAVKKGLQVAARALMSISQYVKNIHKINERMRDLLADIVSDMRSNMTFLAPLLAGIVVGLSAMITLILGKLSTMMELGLGETPVAGMNIATLTEMFNIEKMIPPYFLQIAIGIYLIELIFILSGALITIESGADKLSEKATITTNLQRGLLIYTFVALIATLALGALAGVAIGGLGT